MFFLEFFSLTIELALKTRNKEFPMFENKAKNMTKIKTRDIKRSFRQALVYFAKTKFNNSIKASGTLHNEIHNSN